MTPAEDLPILRPVGRARYQVRSFDPEFDARLPARTSPQPILLSQEYQRLVDNPFLALAWLIAWFGGLRWVVAGQNLALFLVWVAGLALVVPLLHYHCLDCGRTGWHFRWRRHACAAVVARQVSGRVRRYRGPNPTHQLVLWIYLVLITAFLVGVVLLRP